MKKLIIILSFCVLLGCSNAPSNEVVKDEWIPKSRIYDQEVTELSEIRDNYHEVLLNRLSAIQNSEIEEVVIVNTDGLEKTITDKAELTKFKNYISEISLYDSAGNYPGKYMGLGIKLKDKDYIIMNVFENQFCLANFSCDEFIHEEKFVDFLVSLKGEEQQVMGFSYQDEVVNMKSWADEAESSLPFEEERSHFIVGRESSSDQWLRVLGLSRFIDEEFSDYQEIKDQEKLTAGLMQIAADYQRAVEGEQFIYRNDMNDEIHLKNPIIQYDDFTTLFNYYFIPEKALENTGKSVFGETYQLPSLGEKHLFSDYIASYESFEELHYYLYHIPYDGQLMRSGNAYIKETKVEGNRRVYTIVPFVEDYILGEDLIPISIILNDDNKKYRADSNDENIFISKVIEENIDDFNQWEYTLQETGGNIQMMSAKLFPKKEKKYTNQKIDPNKGNFYEEDGYGVINYDSKDAQLFNDNRKAEVKNGLKYIVNENQGLLSIVMHSNIENLSNTSATVLDMNTWSFVSDEEILKRLNINQEHLQQALDEVGVSCSGKPCAIQVSSQEGINSFFISSNNLFGYYHRQIGKIILFDWEEVQ